MCCVCVHTCVCVCAYMCVCVCAYVCMPMYMYVCVCWPPYLNSLSLVTPWGNTGRVPDPFRGRYEPGDGDQVHDRRYAVEGVSGGP